MHNGPECAKAGSFGYDLPLAPGNDRVRLLNSAAGADGAADAQELGVPGQLVGEDFQVAQGAVQTRQHVVDDRGRVVDVVVEARVGQEPLDSAVAPADRLDELAQVPHRAVQLVGALLDVAEDCRAAVGG